MNALERFNSHLSANGLDSYIEYLEALPDKSGITEQLSADQQQRWHAVVERLGVEAKPEPIIAALKEKSVELSEALVDALGHPNLGTQAGWDTLVEVAKSQIDHSITHGLFIKVDVLKEFLHKHVPTTIVSYLGYSSIEECLEKESIFEIAAALRFAESDEWMEGYLALYDELTPDHFEQRDVEFLMLEPSKWWELAGPFAKKKKHHFSHLKEVGVVFSYPAPNQSEQPSAFLEFFMMIMHYIYEVKFYSNFFEFLAETSDESIGSVFMSVLGGDSDIVANEVHEVAIVQQYHLKKPNPIAITFMPHVNPEAFHWKNACKTVFSYLKTQPFYDQFSFWENTYDVALTVDDQLITFNFADNILSKDVHYTYHYKEDLWNALFAAYYGEDELVAATIRFFKSKVIDLGTL